MNSSVSVTWRPRARIRIRFSCVASRAKRFITCVKAITDVELMRIDDDLLDVMATWDEAASADYSAKQKKVEDEESSLANWTLMSGMFSVSSLKYGAFSQLPSAQ